MTSVEAKNIAVAIDHVEKAEARVRALRRLIDQSHALGRLELLSTAAALLSTFEHSLRLMKSHLAMEESHAFRPPGTLELQAPAVRAASVWRLPF